MPDPSANDLTLIREVTATREEFRHGLRQAFPHGVTEQAGRIRVADGATLLEIELTPQAPRLVASLRLPVLRVALHFSAGSPREQRNLLARLDRAMQRGGG